VTGPPNASFTADPEVTDINDPEVNFTNTSDGGVDYEWDFGDNSPNEYTYDATHIYADDEGDSYVVTLIASNGPDCADTTRLVIKVDDVIIFYVPNTFTPDGDPFNQTFQPVFTSGYDPQDFHMLIYNRWGEVIFETYDASVGWNGKYADFGYVPDGTYVWTIEFLETMSDKRHYEQGHLNMLS
jgi:gliding motility-associated-like protein